MNRARASRKNYIEGSDSEDEEEPLKKTPNQNDSSSESDIENYLHKPEKLDFDSEFFQTKTPSFEKIEKNIFAGVQRLSDSESDAEEDTEGSEKGAPPSESEPSTSKTSTDGGSGLSFHQLQDYTKKIEEAKRHVEIYKAKKQAQEGKLDIQNLLAAGERKTGLELTVTPADLHSSDFESCDSEQEWEEIKNKTSRDKEEKNIVPAKALQIVVDMPDAVRKKKGVDLVAAMKRRLNRIRKENQVLVHKVHLLCWIAHGNYVNSIINDTEIMALALSLMPSEQSYPSGRPDLAYLEKITSWFQKTVANVEKQVPEYMPLDKFLQYQIKKKEAYNKKMLALIFVAVLRSLGIQARIVMSLQVEPLRPPASELHSLSTKDNGKAKPLKKATVKINIQKPTPEKKSEKTEPNDTSNITSKSPEETLKRRSKSAGSVPTECRKRKEAAASSSGEANGKKRSNSTESTTKRKSQKVDRAMQSPKSRKRSKSPAVEEKSQGRRTRGTKSLGPESQKTKPRTSSADSVKSNSSGNKSKPKASDLSKTSPKVKTRSTKRITQVDGLYESDSDAEMTILQLDGANDKGKSKPNLKTLKKTPVTKAAKNSTSRPNLKSLTTRNNNKKTPSKKKTQESDSESDFEPPNGSPFKKRLEAAAAHLKKLKNMKKPDVKDDIVKLVKGRISEQKKRSVKKRKSQSDSDSDYAIEALKKKRHDSEDEFVPKTKVKRRIPGRSELLEAETKKKLGNDVWVEVFLEAEEKWISVDVAFGQVHCVKEISKRASHPICYILAWDNNNNVKDVTQRYCPNFNTITRKLRVGQKWWNESLEPFKALPNVRDKEEDDDLSRQQFDQPLPKSIAEYKDHPLYVLRRHLLKFEAIYPPEPATLGFIRGEAVYPRSCVYTLHSRDIWLKQAKVVKLGEQPYKIVKARPKWDKLSNKVITDQMLEIFGPWQVQDYEPPTAENGIVPKNAFGNVDLFKPSMLPKGCVHLKLPGLNRIARRSNIDCPSAIVGFDFHGGWSHPVYDGFVVCKEYEDQLICAWELEQDELDRKEQEKIDKRVYGNWKRLIRGLLIRERLKAKYDFGEPSTSASKDKKKAKGPSAKKK